MKKTIAILILFILLAVTAIVFGVRELMHLDKYQGYLQEIEDQQTRYLDNISKFSENYNELYNDYQELYAQYSKLAADKGFYEDWETFSVTAYTSLDDGCDGIAATGIDIEKMAKFFNFAAVDPGEIPYGSVILVKFDSGIESFLAVDCGGSIKGKKLDLYFVNDLSDAYQFGKRDLEVKVIR